MGQSVTPVQGSREQGPPFQSRGPVRSELSVALAKPAFCSPRSWADFPSLVDMALSQTADIVVDEGLQLSLFLLYGLSYGGVLDTDPGWEWNTIAIAARVAIEEDFERRLRDPTVQPE